MKKLLLMSLVALLTMTMASCDSFVKPIIDLIVNGGAKDPTPTQVTEINQATTMESFDKVKIDGAFRVIYEQGTEYSVRVEATEEAFKEMTVYVKDGELCINETAFEPTSPLDSVKVYVSSPNLKKIDLIGPCLFVAENAIDLGKDPKVFVMNSGKILLTSATSQGRAIFSAMESGEIGVSNLKADEVIADVCESGNINLGSLECKFMFASSESGNINCDNINADEVEANIIGSGNINLKGTIKKVTKDITGSGKLNINETTPTDTIQ